MFPRLGSFAYRHRVAVVLVWCACLALSAPFIPRLPDQLAVGGFSNPDIEAARSPGRCWRRAFPVTPRQCWSSSSNPMN